MRFWLIMALLATMTTGVAALAAEQPPITTPITTPPFLYVEYPTEEGGGLALPTLYMGRIDRGRLVPTALLRLPHHAAQLEVVPGGRSNELWLSNGRGLLLVLDRWQATVQHLQRDVLAVVHNTKERLTYLAPKRHGRYALRYLDRQNLHSELAADLPPSVQLPLAVSPDGARCAFFRAEGGKRQLVTFTVATGKEQVIGPVRRPPLLPGPRKGVVYRSPLIAWLSANELVTATVGSSSIYPYLLERWNVATSKATASLMVPLREPAPELELTLLNPGKLRLDCQRRYRFDAALKNIKEETRFDVYLDRERPNRYREIKVARPNDKSRSAWLVKRQRSRKAQGEQRIVTVLVSASKRFDLLGLSSLAGSAQANHCAVLERATRRLVTVRRGTGPSRPVCWLRGHGPLTK